VEESSAAIESRSVVVERYRVLVDQTWCISPEGLRIEEAARPPLLIPCASITGFGLPRGRGSGGPALCLVVGYRDASGRVATIRVPVLDGTIHQPTRARGLYEALQRVWPELDRGWHELLGADFYARLGLVLTPAHIVPVLAAAALAIVITLLVTMLALR
jgi:hypothetical protein